jgi:paraquat-inducible protein B
MAASKSVAVGAFVLGGLALGTIAILVFGGMRLFTTTTLAVAYFPGSVAGLAVGAPVTFRGVQVGTVESMRVHVDISDLQAVIPVYLELDTARMSWTGGEAPPGDHDLRRAVHAGLRAQLVAQSLVTGQLVVDLDFRPSLPASPAPRGVPGGALEIPAVGSEFQNLKDKVADLHLDVLADKASHVMISVQRILDVVNAKAEPLAQSVLLATEDARVTLQTATSAIRAVQADAARTLVNVDQLSLAGRQQLKTSGTQLDLVLDRAATALAHAETITASLDAATTPRSPERADLQATLRDLAASASSLRSFTRDLQRNPAGTLIGHAAK